MGILSGLFGGDNDSNSDVLGVLTGALSLDGSFVSANESVDEDGSSESSFNSGSIGTDLDIGSIFSSLTDNSSDSDGLFN